MGGKGESSDTGAYKAKVHMKEKGKRCHFDAVEEAAFLLPGCPIVYMSPLEDQIQIKTDDLKTR